MVLSLLHAAEIPLPLAEMVWIAFCIAGALTYGLMRLVYWRAHTAGVPRLLGERVPQALLLGAAGGAVASLAGLLYIKVGAAMGWLPAAAAPDRTTALWLGTLAVAAAPLFEEFIFRGLIFGGLRRSLGIVPATLASAAIFAFIHPPLSVLPVFGLGICAALTYERTKMLAAPMLVHAIYNAVVVGFQWNLMQ
jgi:membrane protease YdiL (CAAX protease family)